MAKSGHKTAAPGLHAGHRERLRQKYTKLQNLDHLPEHEVLEYMLSFSLPRGDVNPMAHALIAYFGSFANVLEADSAELMQVNGVGERTAAYLQAQLSFYRYYMQNRWQPGKKLNATNDWGKYAVSLFIGNKQETFYAIFLNSKKELITAEMINVGNNREVTVYTDVLVKTALKYPTAAGVVFAHNHPGGSLKPSREDIDLTRHLSVGLSYIMKKVVDHVIVAGSEYYSLLENNIMPKS